MHGTSLSTQEADEGGRSVCTECQSAGRLEPSQRLHRQRGSSAASSKVISRSPLWRAGRRVQGRSRCFAPLSSPRDCAYGVCRPLTIRDSFLATPLPSALLRLTPFDTGFLLLQVSLCILRPASSHHPPLRPALICPCLGKYHRASTSLSKVPRRFEMTVFSGLVLRDREVSIRICLCCRPLSFWMRLSYIACIT